MDSVVLVALGAAGLLFGAVDLALIAVVAVLLRRLDAERGINDKLQRNTVTRESLLSDAQERQSRVVLMREMLISLLDLFAREAGIKALRLLIKEIVPQVFEELIG